MTTKSSVTTPDIQGIVKPGIYIPKKMKDDYQNASCPDNLPDALQEFYYFSWRLNMDPDHTLDAEDLVAYQKLMPTVFYQMGLFYQDTTNPPKAVINVIDLLLGNKLGYFICDPMSVIPQIPEQANGKVTNQLWNSVREKAAKLYGDDLKSLPADKLIYRILNQHADDLVFVETMPELIRITRFGYALMTIAYSLDVVRNYGEFPHN